MRSRENGDKTAGRQQTNAHMRAIRDHAHPRIIEPAGAKSVHYDRPDHAVGWWQHPQLVHQFGNLDPAPPSPLILRTCRDDIGIIKEKFEVVSRVCDRAGAPYDQEIDITFGELLVKEEVCLRVGMTYSIRPGRLTLSLMLVTPQPYFWSCRGWASPILSRSPDDGTDTLAYFGKLPKFNGRAARGDW
jgi:hypothetical protein